MAAPKGNKNAKGNRGGRRERSGRKTAHVELRNFEMLKEIFMGEIDRDELLKKLEAGTYNIKEALVAKALSGNTNAQIAIFNKIFPEKVIVDSYERSVDQDTLELSPEKYKAFIQREYRRLGFDKARPAPRRKGRAD